MCFSAQAIEGYRRYQREFGGYLSLEDFVELYGSRQTDKRVLIPKAMELAFAEPQNEIEREIKRLIDEFSAKQATDWEHELFVQRTRLVEADRKLQSKPTKAAAESKRIATNKIERFREKLADRHRTTPEPRDSRFFPGVYTPVIVSEGGMRVVKPMRYQCRPAGKPAFYDTKYPGTYNARRDNLEGFWKNVFGYTHGVIVVNAFFENVSRTGEDGEPENVVLKFEPEPRQDMVLACLWSKWTAPGERDLLSFAAITDEPPAEVAAAGHDRCVIPIKRENIDAWLNPDPMDLAASYAILDDRERPYYEHRLAA